MAAYRVMMTDLRRDGGFLGCCARLRDLLTERHAVQRAGRYEAARDAEGDVIDITPAGGVAEVEEMANYYVVIHCEQCKTPIQVRKAGSKGRIARLCKACRKVLAAGKAV